MRFCVAPEPFRVCQTFKISGLQALLTNCCNQPLADTRMSVPDSPANDRKIMVRTYLLEGFTRHWKTFFVADRVCDVNSSASLRFKADRQRRQAFFWKCVNSGKAGPGQGESKPRDRLHLDSLFFDRPLILMEKEKNAIRVFPDARIPRAVPGRSTGTGGLSSPGTGFPAQVVSFVIGSGYPNFRTNQR